MPAPFEFRGNGNGHDRRSRPRHEFTFRYPRPGTAERPLLRNKKEKTPEPILGAQEGVQKPAPKFASIDNITDSEEEEMEESSDEGESHPRKKRALGTEVPEPAPVPKWSNPDPYTVLPPVDETRAKRKDVVKLIRKAKIAAPAAQKETDAVTTNEDFISFGLDDEEENNAPENAPTGPKNARLPERDPALGNRKRTHDDEIKGYSKKTGKPVGRFYDDGDILDEWRPHPSESGTPWLGLREPALHMGTRLHNEILSFYHWVRPQQYENIIRSDLVSRLDTAFANRYYGAQVRPFGSFASGLYLPTADMDLVLLSSTFRRTGRKNYGENKRQIYAFAGFLKTSNIPVPGSIETIAHARVPILKFVDKLTGLRVDLSFDNDSGLLANRTFQLWKSEFPAMPVIVSIIKQFLLLRGLNEVPTGGLGGFSIICLVTSLLQHLPHGHTESNLGSILMDFFDFYGNKFDYGSVGIRMDPPGYFNKRVYGVYQENKNQRLSIEDPNNDQNDISGGTREIPLIFRCFSDAYACLKERLISTATEGSTNDSILDTIIAANYEEYEEQRSHLRRIFETDPRFAPFNAPPPPPPPPPVPPPAEPEQPPPPPPPPVESRPLTKQQRKQLASRDRAARLKRLRPDIPLVGDSISNEEALLLGGYESQSHMDRDLQAREKAMGAQNSGATASAA
ncbi:hypothetical protein DTO021D3_3796 [Paecilomyces variotii]|nr:hypothetical protein DTO032I3_5497 [Paecilomyces variotii]KAJ9279340.1 hypothetical protein DTO021D3_3796 [Paecilomyces variotii]KAJ9341070.1 hypothetical protein DTO027B6_6342 [Paecilomyces variotii]KAJ9347867.1 hypothetical protein DTO027B9_8782 [Paecilomyces variotii]KAJ9385759.1 hypothetical protein DTO032I4_4100 [Paecilomyces variotii]